MNDFDPFFLQTGGGATGGRASDWGGGGGQMPQLRKAVGNPRPVLIVFRPGMNTDRSEIINCKLYAPQHQFDADKLPPLHEILPTPFLHLHRGQ